ncbi:MAG: hypothetical protein WBV90_13995 [Terrimicrobiaceae bacterium]
MCAAVENKLSWAACGSLLVLGETGFSRCAADNISSVKRASCDKVGVRGQRDFRPLGELLKDGGSCRPVQMASVRF